MSRLSRSACVPSLIVVALAAACTSSSQDARVGEPPDSIGSAELHLLSGAIDGNSLPPNTVALTYDDGPDEHTLEIAQYLASEGIHATFFVNGKRYCKVWGQDGRCAQGMDTRRCDDGREQMVVLNPIQYPESLIDQVQALGHRVANHSEDHCHLDGETAADTVWEVRTTQDLLDRHAPDGLKVFRPPFGGWSADDGVAVRADSSLDALVGPVTWVVPLGNGVGDWACWRDNWDIEQCGQAYLSQLDAAGRRGILLLHDRPEFNVTSDKPLAFTKWLVPNLRAIGITIAPIEQVPEIGGSTPVCHGATCEEGTCGVLADGCGHTLSCGCARGQTCDSGRCVALSSCQRGCADALDACMDALPASQCQASFRQCEQRCACQPTTCAAAGASCGTIPDGCGGSLDCGPCACVPSCPKRVWCGTDDGCGGTCYGRCGKAAYCADDGDGVMYCHR